MRHPRFAPAASADRGGRVCDDAGMENRELGLLVVVLGVAAIAIGGLIAAGGLSWFGRLPGDIRWSGGSTRVYVPITTMILLSLGLSVVSYLLRRFF